MIEEREREREKREQHIVRHSTPTVCKQKKRKFIVKAHGQIDRGKKKGGKVYILFALLRASHFLSWPTTKCSLHSLRRLGRVSSVSLFESVLSSILQSLRSRIAPTYCVTRTCSALVDGKVCLHDTNLSLLPSPLAFFSSRRPVVILYEKKYLQIQRSASPPPPPPSPFSFPPVNYISAVRRIYSTPLFLHGVARCRLGRSGRSRVANK